MALYIVQTDTGLSIEVKVPSSTLDSLVRHYRLATENGDDVEFCRRLSAEMEQVIRRVADWRLREPTAAQLAYAISICRQLKIVLPEEAARSRGDMQRFIAIHSLKLINKRE